MRHVFFEFYRLTTARVENALVVLTLKAYTHQDRIAVVSSVKGKHGETTRYAMLFFQDFLFTNDATAKRCRCVKTF